MYTELRIRKCKLCSHVLLGHLRQKHFFSSCWTHVYMSLTFLWTGDEIVCLVLYDYGCTFIFFLLLVWHMTTGSESTWRRAGFETKPVSPSIFGPKRVSFGPKKVWGMYRSEQGQAVCISANYAWSGNYCLGFTFCKIKIQWNIWAHNDERR